jgi:hypothetical protein
VEPRAPARWLRRGGANVIERIAVRRNRDRAFQMVAA